MTMRRIVRLAGFGLALAFALAPVRVLADTCTADSFGDAVDASAAELRAFSAETQPKLKDKLTALRDHKKWTDPDYETKGLKLVHDAKLDAFDAEAGELLSKIDTLGSPESSESDGATDCANLDELKTASSKLMSVMRAKSAYLIAKIDRELGKTEAAVTTEVAKVETAPQPAAPATAPAPQQSESPAAKAPEPMPDLSPIRRDPPKTETAKTAPPPAPQAETQAPHAAAPASPAPSSEPQPSSPKPPVETERASSWSTTTAEAVIPPQPEPNYDVSPPGTPYELPPPPPGEGEEDASTFDAGGGGYTIDEIREATRGFFGTVSTSLASVIEHAFRKGGRPTAYVLGNEGGGAFLAGLRYGEGTLYLRNGGSQKVYWHGPSIGYDVGAEGSRTLFLIYELHEPNSLFRRFTGVDGSAYLVGGVGMTLLKGGAVTMAPIRSGLGLRLGASIGYVRFSSRPTWNPF